MAMDTTQEQLDQWRVYFGWLQRVSSDAQRDLGAAQIKNVFDALSRIEESARLTGERLEANGARRLPGTTPRLGTPSDALAETQGEASGSAEMGRE
jgi:hypothetical protein